MEINKLPNVNKHWIKNGYLNIELKTGDWIRLNFNNIQALKEQLTLSGVSFELPSDDIFDIPEVDLKNPLEEFYYYGRPPYLKSEQKDFKERLQKALNYLKGN